MGLDMYLYSVPKISGMNYEQILEANGHLSTLEQAKDETFEKVKPYIKYFEYDDCSWRGLVEQITYWRKANQVHHWFVNKLHEGVDHPCFTVEVTKEHVMELQQLCLRVLAKKEHPSKILPTMPGCFFGDTSYSRFYYREVFETEAILSCLIKHFDFDSHYLLYHCWW